MNPHDTAQANRIAYRGDIVFAPTLGELAVYPDGYLVVEGRLIDQVLSASEGDLLYGGGDPSPGGGSGRIVDYRGKLIIPGFVDLHFHAPQFPTRGLGLDEELLSWLEEYTFPEEGKYSDIGYAGAVYRRAIKELWRQGTTRVAVFATVHREATEILFRLFQESGLGAYVGKVNMNRNAPSYLLEDTEQSLMDTREILERFYGRSQAGLVKPIITPRFVPTCSLDLLLGLGRLAKSYGACVQSHLSENTGEVELVRGLHPEAPSYAAVYDQAGLLGQTPTLMAHCVHSTEEEIDLLRERGVYAVHCPSANSNLSSGVMPVRRFIDSGVRVGLGSDVGAGHSVSMARVMISAIQSSKLKWLWSSRQSVPLTTAEAFYLGTKGSGSFFGRVGSFEPGFEFDALVINDMDDTTPGFEEMPLSERLQRFLYTGDERNIEARFVAGSLVVEPF